MNFTNLIGDERSSYFEGMKLMMPTAIASCRYVGVPYT